MWCLLWFQTEYSSPLVFIIRNLYREHRSSWCPWIYHWRSNFWWILIFSAVCIVCTLTVVIYSGWIDSNDWMVPWDHIDHDGAPFSQTFWKENVYMWQLYSPLCCKYRRHGTVHSQNRRFSSQKKKNQHIVKHITTIRESFTQSPQSKIRYLQKQNIVFLNDCYCTTPVLIHLSTVCDILLAFVQITYCAKEN